MDGNGERTADSTPPDDGYVVEPVGVLATPYEEVGDPPRQGFHADARGVLTVFDRFADCLEGISPGDDVDVVWFAHQADRDVHRARGRGVFTTRSPERPNPICVTRCAVRTREGTALELVGVDAVDGTPVLDVKAPIE